MRRKCFLLVSYEFVVKKALPVKETKKRLSPLYLDFHNPVSVAYPKLINLVLFR